MTKLFLPSKLVGGYIFLCQEETSPLCDAVLPLGQSFPEVAFKSLQFPGIFSKPSSNQMVWKIF